MTSNTSNRSDFARLPLRMVGMDSKCFDVIFLPRWASIWDCSKPNLKTVKSTADLSKLHKKLIIGNGQPRNNMTPGTHFSDALHSRS